jgi:hypothetical protein
MGKIAKECPDWDGSLARDAGNNAILWVVSKKAR